MDKEVFRFSSSRYSFHWEHSWMNGTFGCQGDDQMTISDYKDGDTYYLEVEPDREFVTCMSDFYQEEDGHDEVIEFTLSVEDMN